MLHCVKCGSALAEESTLCLKCGFPVTPDESVSADELRSARENKYSAKPAGYGHHVKLWFPLVLAVLASAAVFVAIRMKSDPSGVETVKRHFVFYDEYSHGVWQRKPCQEAGHDRCVDISYTVPVEACGPVTFSWRVFPSDDDLNYEGAQPRVDETKYAFYQFLIKDSGTLVPAQAAGKPVPQVCQMR
jgi:predicted nucleic acid-binding Zn ribbon protein